MIDRELLTILRCPLHPEAPEMKLENDRLICAVCGRSYPIVDDIPHLLPEDGELPPDSKENNA